MFHRTAADSIQYTGMLGLMQTPAGKNYHLTGLNLISSRSLTATLIRTMLGMVTLALGTQ